MSFIKVLVFVAAALFVCDFVSAIGDSGRCPPPSRVYNDKPTCHSDSDCQKLGKVCCPNQRNTKSCVDRAPWGSSGNDQKYSGGAGGGVMCEGVKCMPYEVCKPDPITKRRRCQRA